MKNRAEWLAERKLGIGGSDAAGVLSLPPYHCARKLWYDKRSVPEDYPQLNNPVFDRGHALEEVVMKLFIEKTENAVVTAETAVHPDYPFMRATADGFYYKKDATDTGILEIKTVGQRSFLNLKREGLPGAWLMQMQHYLAVYNRQRGQFAVLWPDGWEFLTFPVKRDDVLINDLILAEEKFWQQVENGPAPDTLDAGDKRCRTCNWRLTCLGEDSLDLPPPDDGEDIPDATEELGYLSAVSDYITAKEIVAEATEMLDTAGDRIKKIIGDRPVVRGGGVKIHYRPQESKRFDVKTFREKHPEYDKDYVKTTTSRPFRVYITEGNDK